jgi:hypothetical protein
MTLREKLILLSGATAAQAAGIVHGEWYHDLIIAMEK